MSSARRIPQDVADILTDRGYTPDELGIKHFQIVNGLHPTGDLTPTTETRLRTRLCGCPDVRRIGEQAQRYQWDVARLPKSNGIPTFFVYFDSLPGRLSASDWRQAFARAWRWLEGCCNIAFAETHDKAKCHQVVTATRIDRPGSVLADQELPTGIETQRPLLMRLDSSESWGLDSSRGAIHAPLTICHETGHFLGLEHEMTGIIALMDPSLNPNLDGPQAWDKEQLSSRYGAAGGQRPDPPMPDPGGTPKGKKFRAIIELLEEIDA